MTKSLIHVADSAPGITTVVGVALAVSPSLCLPLACAPGEPQSFAEVTLDNVLLVVVSFHLSLTFTGADFPSPMGMRCIAPTIFLSCAYNWCSSHIV